MINQSRATKWNYTWKSKSYQLSSSKLKNWDHTTQGSPIPFDRVVMDPTESFFMHNSTFVAPFSAMFSFSKHRFRCNRNDRDMVGYWVSNLLVRKYLISLESFVTKVEKILKGCLDSITSPSPLKIQIMGRKLCLRYKGKLSRPIIWIFTEGECDGMESRLTS